MAFTKRITGIPLSVSPVQTRQSIFINNFLCGLNGYFHVTYPIRKPIYFGSLPRMVMNMRNAINRKAKIALLCPIYAIPIRWAMAGKRAPRKYPTAIRTISVNIFGICQISAAIWFSISFHAIMQNRMKPRKRNQSRAVISALNGRWKKATILSIAMILTCCTANRPA
jgi:hypothetical protein